MNLRSSTTLSCLALAAMVAFGVRHAAATDITYNFTQAFGGASVTGTITTDGTIGVLDTADILSWDITLHGLNGSSLNLTTSDTLWPVAGPDLTADAANLYFNFSGPAGNFTIQEAGYFSSGLYYYCDQDISGPCLDGASAVTTVYTDPINSVSGFPETGNQIIATTSAPTPEPESFVLMLSGMGAIAAYLRRRKAAC